MGTESTSTTQFVSKSFNERRSSDIINPSPSAYASSTENISRLLEGWMRSSPKTNTSTTHQLKDKILDQQNSMGQVQARGHQPKAEQEGGDLVSHEEFDSILSFENLNNAACTWDKSTCDSMPGKASQAAANDETPEKNKPTSDNTTTPPLSFLEKWLLDESASAGQVEEMMELSPMF
jgi:myb proto-oncogene protein